MTSLGFMINYEKSILVPTQVITFWGNIIDSVRMIVYLPREKQLTIKNNAHIYFIANMQLSDQ